ncbi:NUDIX domain-containing protein [bacterium]|nr:NUDIX domain-containing protein [bacterium]
MKLRTNLFDLWVYHKEDGIPKYLLFHTSQEKADKWFRGGRFWQIPGEFVGDDEEVIDAIKRCLKDLNLDYKSIWAAEHTYIVYNSRRKNMEIIPVFAAEVIKNEDVPITWEHSEWGWFTAEEALKRIKFRGLIEGLRWAREFISENSSPLMELRLD